ncbi:MAG: bifunctional metallophosphatase/5'-nucleotidase [Acidobacteria bacterium]|nr:bifunctional metallophosphatase/5'-nucleotidase [Acidobacteriota bacterium]
MSNRIYVDMDDVICQTALAFVGLLEREYGRIVPFERITSFDLGVSFGLTAEELTRFMRRGHHPDVLGTLLPVPGARETLARFMALGVEIEIVTGRWPSTREITLGWLREQTIPYHRLTFVNKYNYPDTETGGDFCIGRSELAERDYLFAVEDSAEMAAYLAHELRLDVALLDRPWNRRLNGTPPEQGGGIRRVANWPEVLDLVPGGRTKRWT